RFEERTETGGRVVEISFEETIEFEQWLVIEANVVKLIGFEFSFTQTIARGLERKIVIVLDARESFFLRRGDDFAIDNKTSGGIVIESRDAKNAYQRASPV